MANENSKKNILFICVHNSARSQMAEGLFRHYYGEECNVYSAGADPRGIHHMSIQIMAEIGIDLSKHRSKSLKEFEGNEMDYVVTVCGEGQVACPFFVGGNEYVHQSFDDPSTFEGTEEEKMQQFRVVRDELKKWLEQFYANNFEK
jgi:arsenate reductase